MATLALVAIAGAAWNIWRQLNPPDPYRFDASKPFAFADVAGSNAPLDAVDVGGLGFVDPAGRPLELGQYRGRKNVVLVITRGNTSGRTPGPYIGRICLYCASQASRFIANYSLIQAHDAEVVVVFPVQAAGERDEVEKFDAAVKADARKHDRLSVEQVPFPLAVDLGLRAVDTLGLRADLARPATYILDKEGRVRFAYVGATIADRPSVRSILAQLAAVNADPR